MAKQNIRIENDSTLIDVSEKLSRKATSLEEYFRLIGEHLQDTPPESRKVVFRYPDHLLYLLSEPSKGDLSNQFSLETIALGAAGLTQTNLDHGVCSETTHDRDDDQDATELCGPLRTPATRRGVLGTAAKLGVAALGALGLNRLFTNVADAAPYVCGGCTSPIYLIDGCSSSSYCHSAGCNTCRKYAQDYYYYDNTGRCFYCYTNFWPNCC